MIKTMSKQVTWSLFFSSLFDCSSCSWNFFRFSASTDEPEVCLCSDVTSATSLKTSTTRSR